MKQFLRGKLTSQPLFFPKGVQTRVGAIDQLLMIAPSSEEKVDHMALLKDIHKETYDFETWVNTEVIRFFYLDADDGKIKVHKLSLEFIRGLANAYGASHPVG